VNPYPQYTESGLPWAPTLPAHWQVKQLRHVGTVRSGGTPTADQENWNGELPFITPPDLRRHLGSEVVDTERTLTEEGAFGSSTAPAGSVLVSIRAPIGHVARAAARVAFNQGCRAVVTNDNCDEVYLTYALLAASAELTARGRGTTFMEVSGGAFSAMKVPQPPLNEQVEIAHYLESRTRRVDVLIAKQQQLIQKLNVRRTAAHGDAALRGLDAGVPMRDTGVPWLGEIPEHWTVRPLWSMFRRIKDVGHPEAAMLSVFREFGVVEKDSRANNNATADNRDIYQLVHPGWLVTNRMKAWQGSVGISNLRGIVSGHYLCFAPTHAESHEFLNILLRSQPYVNGYFSLSRGVRPGQAEIDNDLYRLLPIVLPPPDEQKRIFAYVQAQTAKIDALIQKSAQFVLLAKERRAALVTAAVTGQIDVREAA
jgi:restriction endonuclease S subunit